MLTEAFSEEEQGKNASLHGVLNLLILLLIITSLKNIVVSCRDNGFTLRSVFSDFVQTGSYRNPTVQYTLAGTIFLSVFIIISFWLEVLATTRVNKTFVFVLIILN